MVPCIDDSPYSNIYRERDSVGSFFCPPEKYLYFLFHLIAFVNSREPELPSGPTYSADSLLSVLSVRSLLLLVYE